MKSAYWMLSLLSVGMFMVNMGCSTSTESPGAKDTLGTYTAMVDSTPDKVTTAAQKAAEDLKLSNIASQGTKIDGVVTARDAQGDDIRIDVEQAGDNVSKVSIRVGATGDEAVSKQLVDRIKSHLSWI